MTILIVEICKRKKIVKYMGEYLNFLNLEVSLGFLSFTGGCLTLVSFLSPTGALFGVTTLLFYYYISLKIC